MSNKSLLRLLQAPSVILLLLWMLIPLGMTLYFSFIRYVLNNLRKPEWTTPSISNWRGLGNYEYVLYKSKDFWFAVQNSLLIVGSIIILTVIFGLAISILINRTFPGRGIVRVLLIFSILCNAFCQCSFMDQHDFRSSSWIEWVSNRRA